MRITAAQARRFLTKLHFEGAVGKGESRAEQVVRHARRMGCVQYDPLDVVGRNPDLVMQSRVRGYKPGDLFDALYKKRALIDGYDKNLAIYPAEDYPCLRREREDMSAWYRRDERIDKCMPIVLGEIDRRGPLCSDDLPYNDKVSWPWGSAKVSRAALETLWMGGTLVIHHRDGARRYFDRAERHFDKALLEASDPHPSDEEYRLWQMQRRIGAVGLLRNRAGDAFLGVRGFKAAARERAFSEAERAGEIVRVNIEGAGDAFLLRRDEETLIASLMDKPDDTMRVIAPLDNLMWDRKWIEALYGFAYRWEVYVPKEERKYGYYTLPVLYRDAFVARFSPRHFRGGTLEIDDWWWEEGVKKTRGMIAARDKCLTRFAKFLGADGYVIVRET